MAERGEQNWYPTTRIGYFTNLVREGIDLTRGQIELFEPALAEPYRLDDATVIRAIRVYENQHADQVLFRNQADRWASEVATAGEKRAGHLRRRARRTRPAHRRHARHLREAVAADDRETRWPQPMREPGSRR
ncbi:hypothetical protein ABIA39_007489 [Nocardia sp. GAS34]|uniref:hypothetical protein n=1 Tax=unclassified Nocardia TaxID=2637762 RepID=UPI003D23D907